MIFNKISESDNLCLCVIRDLLHPWPSTAASYLVGDLCISASVSGLSLNSEDSHWKIDEFLEFGWIVQQLRKLNISDPAYLVVWVKKPNYLVWLVTVPRPVKGMRKRWKKILKKFWVKIIFWIAGLRSIRLPRLCHWGSWTVKGRGGLRWVHGNHTLS